MLFPHKKGLAMTAIIGILIVVLSFGSLLGVQMGIFERGEKALEGENCRFSIGLQRFDDEAVPIFQYENTCSTITLSLPERPRRQIENKTDIAQEIANKMMRAWEITHRGQVEDLWDKEKNFFTFSNGCLVVYNINLDYVPDDTFTQRDLYQFLQQEPYKKIAGRDATYFDYVLDSGGKGEIIFPETFRTETEDDESYFDFVEQPIKEGGQYAISILSPASSRIYAEIDKVIWREQVRDFFDIDLIQLPSEALREGAVDIIDDVIESKETTTVLMFSSLDYARSYGCQVRKQPGT